MDFFEHIRKLRSLTRYAVILFVLVVIVNTIIINASFAIFVWKGGLKATFFAYPIFFTISTAVIVGVTILIGLARLKYLKNPYDIVGDLNCRRQDNKILQDDDLPLRILLNVVQEMAIAASVVPPRVYLSDYDYSPNAVLIGSAQKSVLIVTPSAMDLERDELQALVGAVFGTVIYDQPVLDAFITGGVESPLLALLFLLVVVACASLISPTAAILAMIVLFPTAVAAAASLLLARFAVSLISQQKRFLHDVAAIRFTRSPQGIASLMARLANFGEREITNLLGYNQRLAFAPIDTNILDRLFPFHPSWRHRGANLSKYVDKGTLQVIKQRQEGKDGLSGGGRKSEAALLSKLHCDLSYSSPADQKVEGQAIILGLIAAEHPYKRSEQIQYIRQCLGAAVALRVEILSNELQQGSLNKLKILDIASKDFKSTDQFAAVCKKLINWDGQTDPFEQLIHALVSRRSKKPSTVVELTNLARQVIGINQSRFLEIGEMMLITIIGKESNDPARQQELIACGLKRLKSDRDPKTLKNPDSQQFRVMLEELCRASQTQKDQLLHLFYDIIYYDGTVSDAEEAFVRGFCEFLGLPNPITRQNSQPND